MSSAACTICGKPVVKPHAPFCSARCREVDLNRWFTGSYAVAAVELDDVEMDEIEQALAKPESI